MKTPKELKPLIDGKSKYANNRTPEERYKLWHDSEGNRRCCTCNEYKSLSDFHKDRNGPSGHAYTCKACAIVISRKHHHRRMKEDPKYRRAMKNRYIKEAHGITVDEYESLLRKQGNLCAICGTSTPKGGWHLDHNHETGIRREFLCNPCNRGLGYFQDSVLALQSAINYLRKHTDDG